MIPDDKNNSIPLEMQTSLSAQTRNTSASHVEAIP